MAADMLTKSLDKEHVKRFNELLNVLDISSSVGVLELERRSDNIPEGSKQMKTGMFQNEWTSIKG
jgi:hypothetical protein